MGITIVSSSALAAAGTSAGLNAGPSSPDGGAADFSALLGQFAGRALPGTALPPGAARQAESELKDAGASGDDPEAGLDLGNLLAAVAQLPGHPASAASPGEKTGSAEKPIDPEAAQAAEGASIQADSASALAAAALAGTHSDAQGATRRAQESAAADRAALPAVPAEPTKGGRVGEPGDGNGIKGLGAEQQRAQATATGKEGGAGAANIAAETNAAPSHAPFANALAAQQAGRGGEAAMPGPGVATPLHSSHWARDFGDKVVWLARNDQQVAQININPPQLGPLQISLNLAGDQATAVFASPHAEVRQAIEAAMPQLRDMLAGAGINLGQANVGAQLPQQNGGTQQQLSNPTRFGGDNAILHGDSGHSAATVPQLVRGGRGMVDLFA